MYIQPIAWYTAPPISLSTEWLKIQHGVSTWLRCMWTNVKKTTGMYICSCVRDGTREGTIV